ncbi:MAG: CDP-alcohol phosphatidyltransferase family protein [Deltaproteobacteria bacterium]|nr:CDP-alcohol phosphatidyltransferase family protein [Deltaproteobacteria bacterium]
MPGRPKRPLITANLVTVLRLVLIPVPAWLLYQGEVGQWAALVIGTILGCTDFVDGYLARKHGPTVLGALLDPIADKVFIAAAYTPFADLGLIPTWVVALIFARELLVTALRSAYERRDLRLETTYLAKMKTWMQMIGLGVLMILGVLPSAQNRLAALGILTGAGILASAVLLVARSRHLRLPAALTAWMVAIAAAEAAAGRPASLFATSLVVVAITWWSGLEYLVSGWRMLADRRRLDAGDLVRLAGAAILPFAALGTLTRAGGPVWPVIAILALEFAHGGLDNLLAHHRAHPAASTWGLRVFAVIAALGVANAVPRAALPSVLVALALSLAGTAVTFWRGRAIYLSDAAIDEKVGERPSAPA